MSDIKEKFILILRFELLLCDKNEAIKEDRHNWIAMDGDGEVWVYKNKPRIDSPDDCWSPSSNKDDSIEYSETSIWLDKYDLDWTKCVARLSEVF
jgi:hypothetical protein